MPHATTFQIKSAKKFTLAGDHYSVAREPGSDRLYVGGSTGKIQLVDLAAENPTPAGLLSTVLQTLLDPTKLRLFPNIRADMLRRIEQGIPIPGLT